VWHSGRVADHARVRVVVVHYGPADLTVECLAALAQTEWPADRIEVVIVDNGGDAALRDAVRRVAPDARVLTANRNLGFAGGCNLALRDLHGIDRVALVNPDVIVPRGWLAGLESGFDGDRVAAVSPKILFTSQFQQLLLSTEARRRRPLDRRLLGVRVSGAAGDDGRPLHVQYVHGFYGPEGRSSAPYRHQWTAGTAELRVAVPEDALGTGLRSCRLELGADEATAVTVRSGGERVDIDVAAGVGRYSVRVGAKPIDVVNNVGNVVLADGSGADLGYMEADDGRYRQPCEIEAWCGAAVLLDASYLRDVGLFDERLFLYYEDLDLALRGAKRGWTYRLLPAVVVRHHHSAVTVEGSPLSEYYKERNRLLFALRHLGARRASVMALRFLAATASYACRDILSPIVSGHRPTLRVVCARLRAFAGFLWHAPAMVLLPPGWRRGSSPRRSRSD
jgi:GT2 family glycosyltransferase